MTTPQATTTPQADGSFKTLVDPANPIPVSATFSGTIGQVDQGNPAAINEAWPVEVTDGTNVLGTNAHPLAVSAASLPLPTGAATSANQTNGNQVTQVTGALPAGTNTIGAVDVNTLSTALTSQVTVGTGSVAAPTTSLSNRRTVTFKAHPSNTDLIYVDSAGTASSSTGFPLAKGESVSVDIAAGQTWHAISPSTGQTLCILEAAK